MPIPVSLSSYRKHFPLSPAADVEKPKILHPYLKRRIKPKLMKTDPIMFQAKAKEIRPDRNHHTKFELRQNPLSAPNHHNLTKDFKIHKNELKFPSL